MIVAFEQQGGRMIADLNREEQNDEPK
jgi:hypothetical protein